MACRYLRSRGLLQTAPGWHYHLWTFCRVQPLTGAVDEMERTQFSAARAVVQDISSNSDPAVEVLLYTALGVIVCHDGAFRCGPGSFVVAAVALGSSVRLVGRCRAHERRLSVALSQQKSIGEVMSHTALQFVQKFKANGVRVVVFATANEHVIPIIERLTLKEIQVLHCAAPTVMCWDVGMSLNAGVHPSCCGRSFRCSH